MLDSQIAEKADAMEYQLAEQLKLLEANLVKKNNEIKVANANMNQLKIK